TGGRAKPDGFGTQEVRCELPLFFFSSEPSWVPQASRRKFALRFTSKNGRARFLARLNGVFPPHRLRLKAEPFVEGLLSGRSFPPARLLYPGEFSWCGVLLFGRRAEGYSNDLVMSLRLCSSRAPKCAFGCSSKIIAERASGSRRFLHTEAKGGSH